MNANNFLDDESRLIKEIEDAYKIFKLSQLFMNDVSDDYGKTKIARLRLDFARHRLLMVIQEAKEKGIILDNDEIVNTFYHTDL